MKFRLTLTLAFLLLAALMAGLAGTFAWQGSRLSDDLIKLAPDAAHELSRRIVATDTAMLLLGLVVAAAVAAMGVVFAYILGRPLRQLSQAAADLSAGRVQSLSLPPRKDEFGELMTAFNEMAERLRQTQDELDRARNTLDRRVKQRAENLRQAQERLRQTQFDLVQHEKMGMLGHLAAGMAHEVNTPTAAILNAAVDAHDHLLDFLKLVMHSDQLPAERRRWLMGMFQTLFSEVVTRSDASVRKERRAVEKRLRELGYSESRRMAEVIVSYGLADCMEDGEMMSHLSGDPILAVLEHALTLKLSTEISATSAKKIARIVRSLRFYAHEGTSDVSDIDINESIDNTLVILHSRIKHIAQVHVDLEDNLPIVKCGADLLQVWSNILSNACDAIEESGAGGMGAIYITSRLIDDRIVVEIANEGEPISEQVLPKIFDPFFTTKPIGKGTGMGLSICSTILQRWSGTIHARNETGRVVFSVSLPVEVAASAQATTGQALAVRALRGIGAE